MSARRGECGNEVASIVHSRGVRCCGVHLRRLDRHLGFAYWQTGFGDGRIRHWMSVSNHGQTAPIEADMAALLAHWKSGP
jgi:hypothetical protein